MSASDTIWYVHYIEDYERDTAHLTMQEDGGYRRLIDFYRKNAGPIPAEKERLYRCVRAFSDDEKRAIDFVLNEFFKLTKNGLFYSHKRCDQEIEVERKQREKREKRARKAGEERWKNQRKNQNKNNELDATSIQQECNKQCLEGASSCGGALLTTNHNKDISDKDKSLSSGQNLAMGHDDLPDKKPQSKKANSVPFSDIQKIWNEVCGEAGCAKVFKLTEKRKNSIRKRWASELAKSLDNWRQFCTLLVNSSFYMGDNDRGWRADIDWALRPDSITRIFEKQTEQVALTASTYGDMNGRSNRIRDELEEAYRNLGIQ